MKKFVLLLVVGLTIFSESTLALDSCATKDGPKSAVVKTNLKLSLADVKNLTTEVYTAIARQAQEQLGNSLSHNSPAGISLIAVGRVCSMFVCATATILPNILISFSGQTSFEKAILNHVNVDNDKADPSPCDPDKNDNNNEDRAGGGGTGGPTTPPPGSGGGGGWFGPSDPITDPCANNRCIVIITPG